MRRCLSTNETVAEEAELLLGSDSPKSATQVGNSVFHLSAPAKLSEGLEDAQGMKYRLVGSTEAVPTLLESLRLKFAIESKIGENE